METVTVHILEKEYQVACPADQKDALRESAWQLDQQMRKIKQSGKILGLERIAVMSALNTTYELLHGSTPVSQNHAVTQRDIDQLNKKLDEAMYRLRQIEI
jgi:cell division protein ZapA